MDTDVTPARLLDLADMLRPAALRALATLRVADHIQGGADRPEEVAQRCGARPDVMDLLLRYAETLGVVRRDPQAGTYTLTGLGEFLRDDHPQSVRGYMSLDDLPGHGDLAMAGLLHTVRTGEPAHVGLFGRGYWDTINHNPEFAAAMARRPVDGIAFGAELVIDGYDWSGVSHVVDVGGHTGAMLVNLLRAHPHLRGTLVDLENSVKAAAENLAAAGLAERGQAVVGDFFEPLPTGGDVYLLSAVLADWSDEDAVAILRRCAEAAGERGRVLLAEVNLDPSAAGSSTAQLQLYLRAMMPAPVRTVADLTALARRAGLEVTWQGPTNPVRSLLELTVIR